MDQSQIDIIILRKELSSLLLFLLFFKGRFTFSSPFNTLPITLPLLTACCMQYIDVEGRKRRVKILFHIDRRGQTTSRMVLHGSLQQRWPHRFNVV